jgi:hypothetical protein
MRERRDPSTILVHLARSAPVSRDVPWNVYVDDESIPRDVVNASNVERWS